MGRGAGRQDLHQKKMSTLVTAVSRARLRRQPTPMRGCEDSRQTTLSTVVTSSDGSSPFNLRRDTGLSTGSRAPRSLPFSRNRRKEGLGSLHLLINRLGTLAALFPEISHVGYLERIKL